MASKRPVLFCFFGLIPLFYFWKILSLKIKAKEKNKTFWIRFSFLSYLEYRNQLVDYKFICFRYVFCCFFCNSLFYTILILLFNWSKKRLPLRTSYIFLITLWISFEKLHLQWDFSWPWLNLGNVFSEDIHWIQWYEYTGVLVGHFGF